MELFDYSWPFSVDNPSPSNHQKLAEANRRHILGLIWRKNCLSQKDLAARTGLQPSTVSNIIRSLKAMGMLKDGMSIKAGRAGPKETALEVVLGYAWSAGLSLDRRHRLIVVNTAGHIMQQHDFPPGYSVRQTLAAVPPQLSSIQAQHGLDWEKFGGAGISVAGVVDPKSGVVLLSSTLRETLYPLQERMESLLGKPVRVERDVVCGAYAERFVGATRAEKSFLHFAITRHAENACGFGLAAVAEEKIFRGTRSAAGEVDYLMEKLLPTASPSRQGGPSVNRFYRACGEALAIIINLLDIDCLVLAGDDAEFTDERMALLGSAMREHLVSIPGRTIRLHRSALRMNGPLIGAALLALHLKMTRDLAPGDEQSMPRSLRGRSGGK